MKTTIFSGFFSQVLVALGFAVCLGACADSVSVSEPDAVSGVVTLSFDIAPAGADASNPDGHPEEPGIDGELNIFQGDWLHVYVHDATTNDLCYHFSQASSSPITQMIITPNADGTFHVKISTRALQLDHPYRLSVMANCQDPQGDLYNVTSIFYNSAQSPTLLQKPHYMPYSGFKVFSVPADTEQKAVIDIGSIYLLRAVARVEVKLSPEVAKYWQIESASLEGVGRKLYGACYASPAVEHVAEVFTTEQLTMQQMFNPRTTTLMNDPSGTDIPMLDVLSDGTYFRIYLPEQHNPLISSGDEIRIKLTLRHRSATATVVSAYVFIHDGNDVPMNLVRNHIYRYTVRSVKPLLDVDVDIVDPYDRVINVPSYN